jgi:hypothetical protein
MNFLAAMFLTLQLSEEESFWLLVGKTVRVRHVIIAKK